MKYAGINIALCLSLSSLAAAMSSYYPTGKNILGVRSGSSSNDDCLLNGELAGDLGCWGFNNGPAGASTDCNACGCDNNCKVINCDGLKDLNGQLCTQSCVCTADCGDNDPGCLMGGTKGASGGPPPSIEA